MLASTPTVVHVATNGVDWPAVVASISTGVAALAGIGGTIWVATRSWNREEKRAQIADKRQVYASCLAAINAMPKALVEYRSARHTEDSEDLRTTWAELHRTRVALLDAIAELELIAPNDVSLLAWEAFECCDDYLNKSTKGAKLGKGASNIGRSTRSLCNAMRADLGEAPITDGAGPLTPETADQVPEPRPPESTQTPATGMP